jgi:hypothetical protein
MIKQGANNCTEALDYVQNYNYDNTTIASNILIKHGATNAHDYYDYKSKPYKVELLLESGLDHTYLKNINGYDLLKNNLNNVKQETHSSLTSYLLDPIISIVSEYSLL